MESEGVGGCEKHRKCQDKDTISEYGDKRMIRRMMIHVMTLNVEHWERKVVSYQYCKASVNSGVVCLQYLTSWISGAVPCFFRGVGIILLTVISLQILQSWRSVKNGRVGIAQSFVLVFRQNGHGKLPLCSVAPIVVMVEPCPILSPASSPLETDIILCARWW